MTLATPLKRANMQDLIPSWAISAGTTIGGLIAAVLVTRSVAKKKLQEAIDIAKASLEQSNQSMMESQARELGQLRTEVGNLRSQVSGLTSVNASYVRMVQEKELQIADCQSTIRIQLDRISHLESQLAIK